MSELPCANRANLPEAVETFLSYKVRNKAKHYEPPVFGKGRQKEDQNSKFSTGFVTANERRRGMRPINWDDRQLIDATDFHTLDQLLDQIPDYKEHLIHRNAENQSLLETTSKGKSKPMWNVECKFCKNRGSDSDAKNVKNRLDNQKHKEVVELHDHLVKTYPSQTTTTAPSNPHCTRNQRQSSSSPSQSPKRPRVPRGTRKGLAQGNTLSGYNNHQSNFAVSQPEDAPEFSDSSNEKESVASPFELNGKTVNPMSMQCSELLASPIVQELLELDKANLEITAYVAYMMAHSLHIHGRRWNKEDYFDEGNTMFTILEGWSQQLKVTNFHAVYFDEDKHPLKQDLFQLAMSCMKGVLPEERTSVPPSLRPDNDFVGKMCGLRSDLNPEKFVSVNLVNNISNTARYVFDETENGIKHIIQTATAWTDAHCEKVYKAGQKGHAEWMDGNARSVMEQDRKFIRENAQLSTIGKFSAHLLNVDNLEANGTVKQIGTINYPPTDKRYLSMGWAQRQEQKVNILDTYFPHENPKDGCRERDAVKFPVTDVEYYVCYNCAKKYVKPTTFLTKNMEPVLEKAAKECGGLRFFDNPSLFILHVWQYHWLPELYSTLACLHTRDVLDNVRIHLNKLRTVINKCITHYRLPASSFFCKIKSCWHKDSTYFGLRMPLKKWQV